MQNLLLNNELTAEHPKALNVYAQSVLQVISREQDVLTVADYRHLFLDLVFKLQLPVHGSDQEGVSDACQICVNTLTDVFIQYTQSLNPDSASDFEMFSLLWLAFMKVLLQYFEMSNLADQKLKAVNKTALSLESLQQAIQDNLQRVISFLIARRILIPPTDEEPSNERVDLYKKSKEVIGAFWTE